MTKKALPPELASLPLSEDDDEASQVRRVSPEIQRQARRRASESRRRAALRQSTTFPPELEPFDTIPCDPPVQAKTQQVDLERTLRFARLVRETLPATQQASQLLDLAIKRRDAALLNALLKHLYELQQQEVEPEAELDAELEPVRRSTRPTLLPPAPDPAQQRDLRSTGKVERGKR